LIVHREPAFSRSASGGKLLRRAMLMAQLFRIILIKLLYFFLRPLEQDILQCYTQTAWQYEPHPANWEKNAQVRILVKELLHRCKEVIRSLAEA